jgi:hypothetical protein
MLVDDEPVLTTPGKGVEQPLAGVGDDVRL